MITQAQIDAIWRRQEIQASQPEIRKILTAFEALNIPAKTPPLDIAPGQKVFVHDSNTGDDEKFTSLKDAEEFIQSKFEYSEWESDYIDDYVTVIVGREISVTANKVYSVKFS
jgi:hypothetical protein